MSRFSLLIAGLTAALVVAAPTSGMSGVTKLTGSVGPGFTINLKKGTTKVKTLRPGKYAITVQDRSKIHNFRLKGPGLNRQITSVTFVGKRTVTVTLKKGKYVYLCDPHAAAMKGSFTVR